jgi:hypothetical protein
MIDFLRFGARCSALQGVHKLTFQLTSEIQIWESIADSGLHLLLVARRRHAKHSV